jgi:hypothetical protein
MIWGRRGLGIAVQWDAAMDLDIAVQWDAAVHLDAVLCLVPRI